MLRTIILVLARTTRQEEWRGRRRWGKRGILMRGEQNKDLSPRLHLVAGPIYPFVPPLAALDLLCYPLLKPSGANSLRLTFKTHHSDKQLVFAPAMGTNGNDNKIQK